MHLSIITSLCYLNLVVAIPQWSLVGQNGQETGAMPGGIHAFISELKAIRKEFRKYQEQGVAQLLPQASFGPLNGNRGPVNRPHHGDRRHGQRPEENVNDNISPPASQNVGQRPEERLNDQISPPVSQIVNPPPKQNEQLPSNTNGQNQPPNDLKENQPKTPVQQDDSQKPLEFFDGPWPPTSTKDDEIPPKFISPPPTLSQQPTPENVQKDDSQADDLIRKIINAPCRGGVAGDGSCREAFD